jgi:hypothetical protein
MFQYVYRLVPGLSFHIYTYPLVIILIIRKSSLHGTISAVYIQKGGKRWATIQ